MSARLRLCRVDDLPEGAARGFDLAGAGRDLLFVVRCGGALHAYLNACPHWAGSPMAWRRDAYLNHDASRIVCSAHGAQFEIDTGHCTLGPCLGQSLTPVALEVDAQGIVHALGVLPQGSPT